MRIHIKSLLRQHRPILIILLGYCLLSLNYNVASPIFEPPDEATHFRYLKYLLDHKALPVLRDGPNRDELWGLHQPPLAFILYAALAAPFELPAPDDYLARNPHVNLGVAQRPGNKNFYLHTPAEDFPYRGFPLLVRSLRLLSMLFGALTVLVVYVIGLDLFKPTLASASPFHLSPLLPPTLLALQPEFVFITTEIANEPLNILLMAAGLWGCLRLIQRGPSTRLALCLGLISGLIAITKMTGLALILLVLVAMLLAIRQGHAVKQVWRLGLIAGLLTVAVGGWWYGRNLLVYGDPWQANMYRHFYGDLPRAITFSDWLDGIQAGEVSFWATFGWFNIVVPEWIYTFYKSLTRLALLGLLIYFIRPLLPKIRPTATQRHSTPSSPLPPYALTTLLLASPLAGSLILTRLIATEGGIQGRQLLPMWPALAILLVIGYRVLLPGRLFKIAAAGLGAFMAALTVAMPILIIAPAYAPPPLLPEAPFRATAGLPADMIRLERLYDDRIRLWGYRLERDELSAGGVDALTLYWQALAPLDQDYTMFVHALGRKMEKVGQYNGYPGAGNLPTSRWPVGPIIADRVAFIISPAAEAPTLLRLNVGFFDFERLDLPPLAATDLQGNLVSTQIAQQLLLPPANDEVFYRCNSLGIQFADNISLECYEYIAGELRLYWRVAERPQHDYTIFIQLWQEGRQVAGFDGPPFAGDLPTSYWQPDFFLRDVHPLDLTSLAPGQYQLLVGLYNPQTDERLPAFASTGETLLNYAVQVTGIEIE